MKWLAFSYSLPAKSGSSPRVALWRRLRHLGAVASAGIQVLPDRPDCREAFQWLAQELRQAGGQAVILYVEEFAGLSDNQLIELFQSARTEEYAELTAQIAAWENTVPDPMQPEDLSRLQEGLSKLRRQYAEIKRTDYFAAPAGVKTAEWLTQAAQALVETVAPRIQVPTASIAAYQNRRWVTRARPHVDRLACSWLIRRFIDPAARIEYGAPAAPDDVTFDLENAEFGHTGSLCTFETMLRAFELHEAALSIVAQIVHEIDLRDGVYARPETAGIDAILAGWLTANLPDLELERHGGALFDGIYATISS